MRYILMYLYNTLMTEFSFQKEYSIKMYHKKEFAADLIKHPIRGDQSNLIIFQHHNGFNQRWRFIPVITTRGGGYLIVSSYDGGIVNVKHTNNVARLNVGKVETSLDGNIVWYPTKIPGKVGAYLIAAEKTDLVWCPLAKEIKNDDGIGLLSASKDENAAWEISEVREVIPS